MSLLVPTCNATLEQMVRTLRLQQTAKIDLVAPATALSFRDGALALRGVDPVLDESGVTRLDGRYVPTRAADAKIAEKLHRRQVPASLPGATPRPVRRQRQRLVAGQDPPQRRRHVNRTGAP
jgi:hypothetical protein